MGKFLRIVNGISRSFNEIGGITIYDKTIKVVNSTPIAPDLSTPLPAGTSITLPAGGTYVGDELQVYLNGIRLDDVIDYNHTNSTQIQFTFSLKVNDRIRFYIDRTLT
jgi:hypothetical protein